ncbi:MAG: hypothetical protein AAFR42_09235 [Cyanobacteria bacterium J06628_6]
MKRTVLSALTLVFSIVAVVPAALAFEPEISLQDRRLEQLDSQTQAVATPQDADSTVWDTRPF